MNYLIKFLVNRSGLGIAYIHQKLKKVLNKKDLCGILDTIGCDYMHVLPNKFYFRVLKFYGFKIIYSKDFYINQKSSIRISEPSCLLGLKKINKNFSIKKSRMKNIQNTN